MDAHPAGDAPLDLDAALRSVGPLAWPAAIGLVERGRELLSSGEFEPAARHFQRVTGFDDPNVTASALLGLGEALYRLDLEDEALGAWQAVLGLPETPSTYAAWRNVAAARVRGEDLRGAMLAYREADRRAPPEDKAEIAARLGWLAKETGDQGLARRYFARSRGDGPAFPLSYLVIGLTVIVSMIALSADGFVYLQALELDKSLLAAGELYRLISVTLVHASFIHLAFNMYALYLLGPLVEGIWGTTTFAVFYLLTAAAASTASFVVSPGNSVGASGAIFGLVGVLLAGTRIHNPVLDRRARAIIPQLGTIVVVNLAFGFLAAGQIDNAAHIGGLVAGLWLGLVVPPGRARTLRSFWEGGAPGAASRTPVITALIGTAALIAVIAVGLLLGGFTT
jgi:membrane associated rhomboid family serine protease